MYLLDDALDEDAVLLSQMHAPPALDEGIEALAYWSQRRARLPWYRRKARREADEMIWVWERRVRAAVIRERFAPPRTRVRGAALVVRTRGRAFARRWCRRATIAGAAIAGGAAGAFAGLDALARALGA